MNISEKISIFLKNNNFLMATAESCTAGLIASIVAQTPGSSGWLDAGFVVYSPEAKNTSLGVSLETINEYNITSCEVAEEMAIGALQKSRANISIATTGVAGPSGGTVEIPVGTVCFAWAFKLTKPENNMYVFTEKKLFTGTRNEIRKKAAYYGLKMISHYHDKL